MFNVMKRMSKSSHLLYISMFFWVIMGNRCFAKDMDYKVSAQPDGGYSLEVDISKTNLFSADGFFQKIKKHYVVNLIGKGKDWTYRNQKGFYYSQSEILSNTPCWDFGYAWVDLDRTCIYLNLYWVSSPNDIVPSDVNGRYCLTKD